MTVVWSRRAVRHLRTLLDSISSDGRQRAELVAARIVETVELLSTQPHMGRPGRVVGTRELVVPRIPYLIPYRVRGDRLEVIAVFHGRQTSRVAAARRKIRALSRRSTARVGDAKWTREQLHER
jgi:plasmid stabilization system protein ParE